MEQPATQLPAPQMSPEPHDVPSSTGEWVQPPEPSQRSAVHGFPSSVHAVPWVAVGLVHWPLLGSHAPATWHGSSAAQTTGLEPMQTPA
jgi:hypothetical protein